jgi:uncharacterized protein YecE (DUF72 family)
VRVLCGTCAWADHHAFYPRSVNPSDRLAYYARYFSLVEIDSSFYRIPETAHVKRWIAETPGDFVFDLKAYKTLTGHDRGKASAAERLHDQTLFVEIAETLGASGKLGQVLFQYPPWFDYSQSNRTLVDQMVRTFSSVRIGVEFRNRSWWDGRTASETLCWLRQKGYVNVVCDEPQTGSGTIPFVPEVTQPELVVFRLHGRNAETWYQSGLTSSQQRFDYLYQHEELATFLPYVHQWSSEAAEVHILMNNNQGDYAIRNAVDFMNLLSQPGPRPTRRPLTQQLSLFDDEETQG